MSAPSIVSIELLADHRDLIPGVGELRWREGAHRGEAEQPEWWADITGREAGRDSLPVTWVAIDPGRQVGGAVGLGPFDIEERRDRSLWVLGMIVETQYRGRGLGGKLMKALEAWEYQHGYSQTWVASDGAVGF